MKSKSEIINEYKKGENDTGSPEVQIALLTERINHLTEHSKTHKKDHLVRLPIFKAIPVPLCDTQQLLFAFYLTYDS